MSIYALSEFTDSCEFCSVGMRMELTCRCVAFLDYC